MGLKWASKLITQVWRLIYGQWIHHSKFRHAGEALDYHAKELILEDKITDKHEQRQYAQPDLYNPYFVTTLSIILDTLITKRKGWYRLIKTAR